MRVPSSVTEIIIASTQTTSLLTFPRKPEQAPRRRLFQAPHIVAGEAVGRQVSAVVFQPYELEVRKGRLLEWHDLRPSIVDSMRQVCSPFTEINDITPSMSPRDPSMMVCPHCRFHKDV
jgi:hypothetical protein